MIRHYLLIVALFVSLIQSDAAAEQQQSLSLTIDDMFGLIDQNNSDVKVARRNIEVSKQGEEVAKTARLPEVSASLSLNYLGDATILDRDFGNAQGASMPHFGNTLKVTAYQPIYAGGAINGAIDMAKLQTVMSELGFDNTVASVRIKAVECYLNLLKYSNMREVYRENIALTQKLIDNMNARKEQGVALKNDITRYELRLSTLRYDSTVIENNIHVLNNDLVSYLGLEEGKCIIPDKSEVTITTPIDGVAYWQNIAASQSLALKQIDAEHNIALQSDKLLKTERLPKVGLIAGNTFEGPITVEVPPINRNLNYWWVGVNVSYNFSVFYKNNKKEKKSKLELNHIEAKRDATSDAVERSIDQIYTLYVQAHEQLATQRKNVELATENYRIVDRRFNNQLALLTDMLDASTSKLDAEVRLVNAQINTVYLYYQLKFISGTL